MRAQAHARMYACALVGTRLEMSLFSPKILREIALLFPKEPWALGEEPYQTKKMRGARTHTPVGLVHTHRNPTGKYYGLEVDLDFLALFPRDPPPPLAGSCAVVGSAGHLRCTCHKVDMVYIRCICRWQCRPPKEYVPNLSHSTLYRRVRSSQN